MTEEQLTLTEQVKKEKVKFIESGKSKKKHFMAVLKGYVHYVAEFCRRPVVVDRAPHTFLAAAMMIRGREMSV